MSGMRADDGSSGSEPRGPGGGRDGRWRRRLLGGLALVLLGVAVWLLLPWSTAPRDGEPGLAPARPGMAASTGVEPGAVGGVDASAPGDERTPVPLGPEPTSTTSVRLRVVDESTRAPLAGVPVALAAEFGDLTAEARSAVTDAAGEVHWQDVVWPRVRLWTLPIDPVALRSGECNELTVAVRECCEIVGIVTDREGRPLADAEVWSADDARTLVAAARRATTGADGRFAFTVHHGPFLHLFARRPGRVSSRVAMVRVPTTPGVIDTTLVMGEATGGLHGRVSTAQGAPVVAATVLVHPSRRSLPPLGTDSAAFQSGTDVAPLQRAVTDEAGGFVVDDVPPGAAYVRVAASGFADGAAQATVAVGECTWIEIVLGTGGRLVGTVKDDQGRPVPDALVVASSMANVPRATRTDASGGYVLELLQPGHHRAVVSTAPNQVVQTGIEVSDRQATRWDPVLPTGGTIRGQLRWADGAPAVGIDVAATRAGSRARQVRTDAAGHFAVPHCQPGSHRLRVAPVAGGRWLLLAPDVQPDGPPLEFQLPALPPADAALSGRLLTADGRPAAAQRVLARGGPYAVVREVRSDGAGRFVVDGLMAGAWHLECGSEGAPPARHRVDLGAGARNELGDMVLPRAIAVTIELRGGPAARLRGDLTSDDGGRLAYTPIDGDRVLLPPLGPGRYRLVVWGPTTPRAALSFTLVAGQPARLVLDIETGSSCSVTVRLPVDIEGSDLRFALHDAAGTELVWWREVCSDGEEVSLARTAAATRLTVVADEGPRGEVALSAESVVVHLR